MCTPLGVTGRPPTQAGWGPHRAEPPLPTASRETLSGGLRGRVPDAPAAAAAMLLKPIRCGVLFILSLNNCLG